MSIPANHSLPSLQDRESFTQCSFEELLSGAREKKLPFYLMAVTKIGSVGRESLNYYDAESFDLWENTTTKYLDPLTNSPIRKTYYVAINLFDFDRRGVDHKTDLTQVNAGTNVSDGLNGRYDLAFLEEMIETLSTSYDSSSILETAKFAKKLRKIGVSLYTGSEGCQQDKSHARHWLLSAAKLGDSEAQYKLGRLHMEPDGTPQNHRLAKEWLITAADTGAHMNAQFWMGLFHEHCTNKPAEAKHWFELASENGHPTSAAKADEMSVKILHQGEMLRSK